MYCTLYGNEQGDLIDYPALTMLGRSGNSWLVPEENEMIPLPRGASLVRVPQHVPVGLDAGGNISCCDTDPVHGKGNIYAVAALLPQGFTRTLLPAAVKRDEAGVLPLLGYAAIGFKNGQVYAAAVQTDGHRKWHPAYYNTAGLPPRIQKLLKKYPGNRILRQLSRCALQYSCYTAQNIFYHRWEGGIPTTPSCNASCLGCISESHDEAASPQNRLTFVPTVEEITQLGIEHLNSSREPIISFGQGCEGEPSLNADLLARAIKNIRQQTMQGTININTNAGWTEGIGRLVQAGLDAMRVTVFSFRSHYYNLYHRPINYDLASVEDSIDRALDAGVQVSINYLAFPGFTDQEDEVEALIRFVHRHPLHMIQIRNLNMDPEQLMQHLNSHEQGMGMAAFLHRLQEELPSVKLGSYTHPVIRQDV